MPPVHINLRWLPLAEFLRRKMVELISRRFDLSEAYSFDRCFYTALAVRCGAVRSEALATNKLRWWRRAAAGAPPT